MTDVDRAVDALAQAITNACAERGGSCNRTPDGLLSVEATFDPAKVVEAVLSAARELPGNSG